MRELSDLLEAATPEPARPPTEAIVRRGRRRVRRTRALVGVAMLAGVLAAAGVLRATALSSQVPTVVNTPTGSPTPSPEMSTVTDAPSETAPPDAGEAAMAMTGLAAGGTPTPDVAYLDPADTGDDLLAGVPDVLHGMVDGQPVEAELTGIVDRQQLGPALVQDPADPAVVYYNAVIGLEDCIANSADRCHVRHAVRRVDLRTGMDELVVDDAMSIAVGAEGQLATVRLDPAEQELGPPPRGRIAVRGTDGEWISWTSDPARYHLQAWANQDIVAAVDTGGHHEGTDDLVLIDGPGSSRPLVDHGSDGIGLLDLSPSGEQALVRRTLGECCDTALLLVELDTGTILDQLDYRAPGPVLSGGAWLSQSQEAVVVVGGGPLAGNGLQRITMAGGQLHADPPLPLEIDETLDIYAISASASPDRVAMVLGDREERPGASYATCRIRERHCHYHGIGGSPHAAYLAEHSRPPAG